MAKRPNATLAASTTLTMGESRYEPLSQAEEGSPVDGSSYPLTLYPKPQDAHYDDRPASSSSSEDDDDDDEEKKYPGITLDDEELDDVTPRRQKDPVGTGLVSMS
jgi:hypothetical protein